MAPVEMVVLWTFPLFFMCIFWRRLNVTGDFELISFIIDRPRPGSFQNRRGIYSNYDVGMFLYTIDKK